MIDQFGDDSPSIYGAWCALLTIASGCPERGVLASSRGEGLSIERIARMAYFPTEVFQTLFDWARRPDIGWIEPVKDGTAEATQSTTKPQSIANQSAIELPNPTLPNPTQPKNAAKKSPRDGYPNWFEKFWEAYPPNDKGRRRGKAKAFKIAARIPAADRDELVMAAKNYRKDQGGEFIRDPERFLKDEWWRDHIGEPVRERVLKPQRGVSRVEYARAALIKKHKVNEARDWSDEMIMLEFEKLENQSA